MKNFVSTLINLTKNIKLHHFFKSYNQIETREKWRTNLIFKKNRNQKNN